MTEFLMEKVRGKKLTKAQVNIFNYIMDNKYSICNQSLMEVAKATDVSDVSVLRFVRMLGYSGFPEFKEDLYKKLTEEVSGNSRGSLRLDERLGLTSDQEASDVFEKFLNTQLDNLSLTLTSNSQDVYNEVVKSIDSSRFVMIYGSRGKSVADHFSRTLRHIKGPIMLFPHESDAIIGIQDAGPEDLFIFITMSRFRKKDFSICEKVKKRGLKLCVITNSIHPRFVDYADHILFAHTESNSYFNSTVGINAVCEYITMLLGMKNESGVKARLSVIDSDLADERM